MLTPAEELGLSGLTLASRVRKRSTRSRPAELAELIERLRAERSAHHLIYLRDGEPEPIRVLPAPSRCCPTSSPTSTTSR